MTSPISRLPCHVGWSCYLAPDPRRHILHSYDELARGELPDLVEGV